MSIKFFISSMQNWIAEKVVASDFDISGRRLLFLTFSLIAQQRELFNSDVCGTFPNLEHICKKDILLQKTVLCNRI